MKVYYAHPMTWYGSAMEAQDVALLRALYPMAEIINPGLPHIKADYDSWRAKHLKRDVMEFFAKLVRDCDVVAFRAYADDAIGADVAREIFEASMRNIPVHEIVTVKHEPFMIFNRPVGTVAPRFIDIEATRERTRQGVR